MQNPKTIATLQSLHAPERAEDESFEDYKQRRAASKAAARALMRAPEQMPAVNQFDTARFFLGHVCSKKMDKASKRARAEQRCPAMPAAKEREHKPHAHATRDKHGAVTLIGRDPLRRIGVDGKEVRRIWLGGVSAMRGY